MSERPLSPLIDVCDACLAARPKTEIYSVGHLTPQHCDDCGRLVTERDVKSNWQTVRIHRIANIPRTK